MKYIKERNSKEQKTRDVNTHNQLSACGRRRMQTGKVVTLSFQVPSVNIWMESIIIIIILLLLLLLLISYYIVSDINKHVSSFFTWILMFTRPLQSFFWASYWTLTLIRMTSGCLLFFFTFDKQGFWLHFTKKGKIFCKISMQINMHITYMCMTIVAITLQLQFIFVLQNKIIKWPAFEKKRRRHYIWKWQ